MLLWWNGRKSTVCVFAVDKRRPRSFRRTLPPTATEPPLQATSIRSIRSILNWLHTIYESYLKWEALPCNQSKMFFFFSSSCFSVAAFFLRHLPYMLCFTWFAWNLLLLLLLCVCILYIFFLSITKRHPLYASVHRTPLYGPYDCGWFWQRRMAKPAEQFKKKKIEKTWK